MVNFIIMEINLIKEIHIGNKAITHFTSFSLKQKFNAHHYFELKFNHDQLGLPGLITLDDSRDFVGETLSASIGYIMQPLQNFVGIVTKVELTQSNGYHGILVVSGYSPTILIDRGPDLGSYLDKSLNDIVSMATHDTPVNDLRIITNATRKNPIDYVIQYRESDFEFLNRLSGEYYEWFFYDGMNLNFGKPDQQKEIPLFYGRDVHSLQYGMEVAPIKNKRFAYNPRQDEMLQSESTGNASGRADLIHAINASNKIYSKTFNQPTSIRVDSGSDIKNHVDNEEKANISKLLKISGSGDNPQVALGSIVEITMSLKQGISFATESLGKFLITSVNHTIDERGRYANSFEGLVSTTDRLLFKDYIRPNPDLQLANVVDNNDPKGQGRVKVKFKWACQTNNDTEWLRVITPDAGSSDKVNKNRGFVFIPEKGDQVLIAFEEGNIARPIVIGSIFHGKNGSGGNEGNKIKSLITRSGCMVRLDDSKGSVTVKDPSGNILKMHGNGSATLSVPNTFTINTTDLVVNAGNSITLNAQPGVDENGKEGSGEGKIVVSAKKSIEATADTEDISLTATERNILLTANLKDIIIKALESNVELQALAKDIILKATSGTINAEADTRINIHSHDTQIF